MKSLTPFRKQYSVEVLEEMPGVSEGSIRFYYPGASKEGGHEGILVKVIPDGSDSWVGCFAFGYSSPQAISLVSSCPHPEWLCVVSSGAGYLVNTSNPNEWRKVNAFPIVDFSAIVERRLLIFCDFTQAIAYNSNGVGWTNSHLSSDGLRIIDVTGRQIKVGVRRADEEGEFEIILDSQTGRIISGY